MDLFAHHIRTIDGALEKDFCQHLIDKFKTEEEEQICISSREDWSEEDSVLEESINEYAGRYFEFIKKSYSELKPYPVLFDGENYQDGGYYIRKYEPGRSFDWHQDFAVHGNSATVLSIIWYLNTVEDGGETEFANGLKIQPEVGKILIFPATWTYVNKSAPPTSENKYEIASFITGE